MEPTEKIVETYVRYVRGWATIPNIKCPAQYVIDLLAIDPLKLDRYHMESGVSISGSYSKLTAKPYSDDDLKIRVKTAGQRRTIGYFAQRKFGAKPVLLASSEYYIHHNQFLERTEVRDESGRTKWYLRENIITGRTEIRTVGGQKTGEIPHNRFLDRVEIMDRSGQNRLYLRKNPFLDRVDIFRSTDGRRTGEIRYNRFLDRTEVTVEEVK